MTDENDDDLSKDDLIPEPYEDDIKELGDKEVFEDELAEKVTETEDSDIVPDEEVTN